MHRLLLGASPFAFHTPQHVSHAHACTTPNHAQLQADALRRNFKKLVPHFGGVQPYSYAGIHVGLRQYSAPLEGRGAQRSTSLDRWLADAQAAAGRR